MKAEMSPADGGSMGETLTRDPMVTSVYESLFVHGIDGVLLATPDGRIQRANGRACELLGWTEDELAVIGREGIADRRDPRWAAALETRAHVGYFRGVLSLRRSDGTTFPAEITSAEFSDGNRHRAYVTFRDLSAEEAEAARTAETRRAAAEVIDSLESISDMYVGVDGDWRVTYINAQALRIYYSVSIYIHHCWDVRMTKRLIDLDDELLALAQRELNTSGVSDTVRAALRHAANAAARARQVTWLREGGLETMEDSDKRADVWR